MNPVEVAVAVRSELGESATWSVADQALWWVDLRAPAVHRLARATGEVRTFPWTDVCPAVIQGERGLFVAGRDSIVRFDPQTGAAEPLARFDLGHPQNRLNEGRCDRQGRLRIGSMRDHSTTVDGGLHAVGPDGEVRRIVDGIKTPNSLCWSPDGATMYFADTGQGAIWAYDYDIETGSLGTRRVLLEAGAAPGRPDGSTVDAEGFVWNARLDVGQVIRVSPQGRVAATVELPTSFPTSLAFGGPGLRTLYVTTMRRGGATAGEPLAGALLSMESDIPGLPEPLFAG